jgi:hypothetical protein
LADAKTADQCGPHDGTDQTGRDYHKGVSLTTSCDDREITWLQQEKQTTFGSWGGQPKAYRTAKASPKYLTPESAVRL